MDANELIAKIPADAPSGSVAWGDITGNPSDQTDLIALIPTATSDLTNDSNFASKDYELLKFMWVYL